MHEAAAPPAGKIPAALIVTGPNIASQDLLFAQLSGAEDGAEAAVGGGRFVRLRAAEAPNLKAALRKIVRDVVTRAVAAEDGEGELAVGKDVSCPFLSLTFLSYVGVFGFASCCWLQSWQPFLNICVASIIHGSVSMSGLGTMCWSSSCHCCSSLTP